MESSDYEVLDDWEDWKGVERRGEGHDGNKTSDSDDEDGGEMMPILNW